MLNPDVISEEQRRSLLDRILASPQFRKSPKLSAFLRFVDEQDRIGKSDLINEQSIGTNVFGRAEGYHVGEDSIVRSQARFLRQRLDDYFAKTGSDEPVLLCIPKGCYLPLFRNREEADGALLPSTKPGTKRDTRLGEMQDANTVGRATEAVLPAAFTVPDQEVTPRKRLAGLSWGYLLGPVVVVVCFAVVAAFLLFHRTSAILQAKETAEGRFWNSIFDASRTQIIVPSDSSLVLLEKMDGHTIPLADYMSRQYLNDAPQGSLAPIWHSVAFSQYTSLADLNLVSRLERRSEAQRANVQIRYSRDLALDELKHSNAILIGGKRSNPWVTLFAPMMHYNVDFDEKTKENYVSSQDRGNGKVEQYSEMGHGEQHAAYGVIAYLPSLDGQGNALLVEGTSKAGTEAAAEFLLSSGFSGFLRNLPSDGALPHFELLIATQNTNGESHDGRIIKFHRLD